MAQSVSYAKDYVERILQPVFTALSVFPTITQQTVGSTSTVFLSNLTTVFLPVGQIIFLMYIGGEAGCEDVVRLVAGAHLPEEDQVQRGRRQEARR